LLDRFLGTILELIELISHPFGALSTGDTLKGRPDATLHGAFHSLAKVLNAPSHVADCPPDTTLAIPILITVLTHDDFLLTTARCVAVGAGRLRPAAAEILGGFVRCRGRFATPPLLGGLRLQIEIFFSNRRRNLILCHGIAVRIGQEVQIFLGQCRRLVHLLTPDRFEGGSTQAATQRGGRRLIASRGQDF
jgi:hypothetical protein